MSTATPVRVAVIGCGANGTHHARYLASTGRSKVVLVCDVDASRAEALAAETGARAVTETEQVLHASDVDAVWICTHHDSHRTLAIRTAQSGKHVFIEKPLALTIEDCTAMVDALETAGVLATVGFKFRFFPAVMAAHSYISAPLMTIAHVVDDEWPEDHWANHPTKGGGNVLSEGVHIMDLVVHLHNALPVRIHAEGGRLMHPDAANPDHAVITMAFPDGSIATVAIGESGQSPLTSKFGVQMSDGQRSLNLHNRLTALEMRDKQGRRSHQDEREVGVDAINDAFIGSIVSGTPPSCGPRDGLRATALILAAFESIRSGVPVDLTCPPFGPAVGHSGQSEKKENQ